MTAFCLPKEVEMVKSVCFFSPALGEGGKEGGRGGGRVEREAREEEEEALIRRLVTIYFEKEETVEKACFF